jgi:hypothetical protein
MRGSLQMAYYWKYSQLYYHSTKCPLNTFFFRLVEICIYVYVSIVFNFKFEKFVKTCKISITILKYAHSNFRFDIMTPRNEFISHSAIFSNN